MELCSSFRSRTLEEQLFLVGIAVPFIALPLYLLYAKFLQPLWPFHGCLWDLYFGIYCPGCGGTRAVYSLLRGQLIESFLYHPVVIYAAVIYGLFMISHGLSYVTGGRVKGIRYHNWYLYGAVVITLLNFLIRNVLRLGFDIYL